MAVEGPVGVQVIEGQEDKLKIDESKINSILENVFEGDQIAIDSKLREVISNINAISDKLLDIKTLDRGAIDASDGVEEKKVVLEIANKINNAIKEYINSEGDTINQLMTSLDDIGKGVELSLDEQGYYQEFFAILQGKQLPNARKSITSYYARLDNALNY